MNLPSRLGKPTIIEAVLEFRYSNKIEIEELFFVARSVLESEGYIYHKMQIMEMPPAVREGDPLFKYAAHYSFDKGSHIIGLSPYMLSFNIKGFYPGWEKFYFFVQDVYKKLKTLTDAWKVERTSMRYIDFFENINIFENIKIETNVPKNLCGNSTREKNKNFISDFECDTTTSVRMQIANGIQLATQNNANAKTGDIVDIDVFSTDKEKGYEDLLSHLHNILKQTYFNLLKESFIKTLEPIYEKE